MKKLGKLKLNDFHEMSDVEMKKVVGGTGHSSGSDCPTDGGVESKCSQSCWVDGTMIQGDCGWVSVGPSEAKVCACIQK